MAKQREFSLHTQHDHYEELCALAVSGQIALAELENLKQHMQGCAECRDILSDFGQIAAQAFPEFASERVPVQAPAGMDVRFLARARSQGIPLRRKTSEPSRKRGAPVRRLIYAATAVAAILLSVLIALIAKAYLHYELAHHTQVIPNVADPSKGINDKLIGENAALAGQVRTLQAQTEILAASITSYQQRLESSQQRAQAAEQSGTVQAKEQLEQLEKANEILRSELAGREREAAAVQADLAKLGSMKENDEIEMQANRAELNELRERVGTLSSKLHEAEQLSAAANQAKDLIVARKLHIIDVHDNANGNKPRPFGRIFYTEGQKLLFYAYDLGDPKKLNAKVSFYVWGERAGNTQLPRSLGVLRPDDMEDGRWVLTFDNSRALDQINIVFVTAESRGKNIAKPNGNRILIAFLDGEPNHP